MTLTTNAGPPDSAQRLSTQPLEVMPTTRRSAWVTLRRGWRQLTSMRTALTLLFLLALAAVPGTLLPQRGLNPVRVSGFFLHHPKLAPILDKLSLFDVFAAPWFGAIYLLLFISLAGCLVPRIRLHAKAIVAKPPKVPSRLDRLPQSATWQTSLSPDEAYARARTVLRRGRWRVALRPAGVSAEKGHSRETGNLVFHVALLMLLVGIGLGSVYGYQGTVLVSEGDSFTDTVTSFDQFSPGRLVHPADLTPFSFTLDAFRATYQPSGEPRSFDAQVHYRPTLDAPLKSYDIRVNHPLRIGAAKVYLLGHGYALPVTVTDKHGVVVYQATVPCLPQNGGFVSDCTIKVPDASPQLGILGFLYPSGAVAADGSLVSVNPALGNPLLQLRAFSGDLGLNTGAPRSVYSLDTTNLTPAGTALLALRDPAKRMAQGLPGGATITVGAIKQWATFQIKRDPAKLLTLLAAVLMVGGLIGSLSIKRRRLWVRARAVDGMTVVEVGGLARTDADGFAAEMPVLVARLRDVIPVAPVDPVAPAVAPMALGSDTGNRSIPMTESQE